MTPSVAMSPMLAMRVAMWSRTWRDTGQLWRVRDLCACSSSLHVLIPSSMTISVILLLYDSYICTCRCGEGSARSDQSDCSTGGRSSAHRGGGCLDTRGHVAFLSSIQCQQLSEPQISHTHSHTLTHSLTLTHTHSLTLTHTHSHSLTHTHSHSHSLTRTHSLTHSHSLTLTHTHSLTLTHTHSHSLTLTLTHTHSHSFTLTHSQQVPVWYIMDEFGSRIPHSDTPSVAMTTFFYIPRQLAYCVLWLLSDLKIRGQ